jgi:hypothetical protein
MPAHRFSIEQMVELVNTGLASATAERAGRSTIEVARVRITEAEGGWWQRSHINARLRKIGGKAKRRWPRRGAL